MNERLIDIETKLAFQEHALAELNDAVLRQQAEIRRLTAQVEVLTDRLRALAPSPIASQAEETPPPHY